MFETYPDPETVMVYGAGRYYFELHLSAHTIKIFSDWFYPKNNGDKPKAEMQNWKSEYFRVRFAIAKKIEAATIYQPQSV